MKKCKNYIQEFKIVLTKLDSSYITGTNKSLFLFEVSIIILVLQFIYKIEPITIIEIITSTVSGLYIADVISGIVHILFDHIDITNVSNPKMKHIISEFKKHHKNPKHILSITNITHLRNTSITPIPIITILYNIINNTSKKDVLTQIIAYKCAHMSQIIHKYAHYINHASPEDKQKIFTQLLMFLQKYHLIVSPEEHRTHHQSKHFDINFSIVNGWANPLLNTIVKHTDILKRINKIQL